MHTKLITTLILLITISISSCKKDKDVDAACDSSQPPIVFAHGLLASGDTYANHYMRLTENGYCADRIFIFDWNTLLNNGTDTTLLRLFIDSVLQVTNSEKVVLAGHSAGGGLGYRFCSDPTRAAKILKYIHIGSQPQTNAAGDGAIPTMNIWSSGDKVVQGADIPNATNVNIPDKDHYEVATCPESFAAIYKFVTSKEPTTTDIVVKSSRKISGKALQLGENTPLVGATIKVFEVDVATGERKNAMPDFTLTSRDKGYWGPVDVNAGAYYEFEVKTTNVSDRVVHYYREPFVRDNPLVYLRTLPSGSSLAAALLSNIPKDDTESAPIAFISSRCAIAGRDVLKLNDIELTTTVFASETASTIAFFIYDENKNKQTDLTAMTAFASFPFLEGVDMFLPTTINNTTLEFNGRVLRMKNWKSDTEGIGVAVFD